VTWPLEPGVSDHVRMVERVHLGQEVSIGPFTVIGFDPTALRARFHRRPLSCASRPDVQIGDGVTIGAHCVIEAGVVIHDNCYIDHGSFVGADSVLEEGTFVRYRAQIHRRVRIGPRTIVGGFVCNDVTMGADCDFFGMCVHRYIGVGRGAIEAAPRLGDRVFVGFNAVVAGAVVLADDAIVKAGVVISDVERPGPTAPQVVQDVSG
jgi:UDP-3-O-[3-hydroxymyristoyl] glucosamine N-acyltransferase